MGNFVNGLGIRFFYGEVQKNLAFLEILLECRETIYSKG